MTYAWSGNLPRCAHAKMLMPCVFDRNRVQLPPIH
jgi:hypothetical protein